MRPAEEDPTCLTSLLELKVDISLLAAPPSQGEALWAVLTATRHRGAQPGCCEGVQHRWRRLVTCLLVSWLCAYACMKALFPEGAVPPERFAHSSLLCPYSLGSVHRSRSPQHSRMGREEIPSFLSREELRAAAAARRGGVSSA